MPMIFREIQQIETIDLDRHALIEASAGTGKTYTLAHLVIRLLKERTDLGIGNILLVTFTEKAAGELKERVRQLLVETAEKLAETDPEAAKRFKTIDATFDDEAAIYTIHGFCHRLLKDYAFENQALFASEMVADPPLVMPQLRAEVREKWPQRHGRYLPEMMQLAGFSKRKGGVMAKVTAILQKTPRPDLGDQLLPKIDSDYSELRKELMSEAQQLDSLLYGSPVFADQYEQLNIRKNSKQANIKNIIVPLARWAQSPDPVAFGDITHYSKIKKDGADALTPKWLKAGDNSAAVCPDLFRVKEIFARLLTLHEQMAHYLVVRSIEPLKNAIQAAKAREGLLSYDDMIDQVHRALFDADGGDFADAIRNQYQVALVDEFQDTDPLQWRIFRKLFLQGPSQRLFLIGDPKQAIYGFRGADLYTYLAAKKEMANLVEEKKASLYTLSTNYRSTCELIAVYNQLFKQPEWFGVSEKDGDFVTYRNLYHPSGDTGDKNSVAALHLIDVNRVDRIIQAYPLLAEFIAQEIQTLVSHQPFAIYDAKIDSHRAINWSDVTILIRRKKGPETVFLERALSAHTIPFSYYKKPGLFQSKEAYYLATVLQAVATPHDRGALRRAFLTPFFDLTPDEVIEPQFSGIAETARRHLMDWKALAEKRQWGAFFEALLTTSGFTFRISQKPFWERQITNYRHLFELLVKEAMGSNLDLYGLLTLFWQKRDKSANAGAEEEIHRIETELPKVQLMTMHAAKGLEFPVVFVAGGLTQSRVSTIKSYHVRDGFDCHQVIDLTGKSHPNQVKKEHLDEEKNLYYVAMTRAQQRLYFPFMKGKKQAGPVGGFIATAIENAFGDRNQGVAWRHLDEIDGVADLPQPKIDDPKIPSCALLPQPLFPENRTYFNRVIQLASFSSLQQKSMARGAGKQNAGLPPLWWDISKKENDEPATWQLSFDTKDELPGGKDMGSCFHLILEKINYRSVAEKPESLGPKTPSGQIVDQAITGFAIDPKWRAFICRIVRATLTTPLTFGNSQITLGHLPSRDRLHEASFFFSLAEKRVLSRMRGLRGAIDLVFRQENRYYVVDFKSNKLQDYEYQNLAKSIEKDGYERQYRIYAAAIYRWLAQLKPGCKEEVEFGGVFYLYLRGLAEEGTTGIYFVPPEKVGSPEEIERQLKPWFNQE